MFVAWSIRFNEPRRLSIEKDDAQAGKVGHHQATRGAAGHLSAVSPGYGWGRTMSRAFHFLHQSFCRFLLIAPQVLAPPAILVVSAGKSLAAGTLAGSYTTPQKLDPVATSNAATIDAMLERTIGQGVLTQYYYASNGADGGELSFDAAGGSIMGRSNPSDGYTAVNPQAALLQNSQGLTQPRNDSPKAGGLGGGVTTMLRGVSVGLDFDVASHTPVYGILDISSGGQGGDSSSDKSAGGAGGATRFVSITLADSAIAATDAYQAALGSGAVGVRQTGGNGGIGAEDHAGGAGGAAGGVSLSLQDSTLTATGANIAGIDVVQAGGDGGAGDYGEPHSNGGNGGNALGATVTLTQAAGGAGNTITTSAGSGISVMIRGGAGGVGSYDGGAVSFSPDAGSGGSGGNAGTGGSTVTASGVLVIDTAGDAAPGIDVVTLGGNGGDGGKVNDVAFGNPGFAGVGGYGGDVRIDLGDGAVIGTGGSMSSAVLAEAHGGDGGASGYEQTDASDAVTQNGGVAGDGGQVHVTLADGVKLSTAGDGSDGVTARSQGGQGGAVGFASGGFGEAHGGNGGRGGNSGAVTVESAAGIETTGDTARGILAQSLSGVGGAGGDTEALSKSVGGGPGAGGNVGTVQVENMGTITTQGEDSQGILAQSIAGSGGAGGSAGFSPFSDTGGKATDGSNANTVDVINGGSVTTGGQTAHGIVAQSIGGGGGAGGAGYGVFTATGADGGDGGDGSTATVELGGTVATAGTLAHGVVAQSVGGGGGVGGNGMSGGVFDSVAIGGSGGAGGTGGLASIVADAPQVTTTGSGAIGIVVQSVGGGGGAGGAADSIGAGAVLSVASAVGGSGGAGGDGQTAALALHGGTITTGGDPAKIDNGSGVRPQLVDADGIVVQSIGGGGGTGGGASALSTAIAVPIPLDLDVPTPTASLAVAVGGSGGNGGSSVTSKDQSTSASAMIDDGANIATSGDGAIGAMVQSIGGGGGSGGDSSAIAGTVGFGVRALKGTTSNYSAVIGVAVGGQCDPGETCTGGDGGVADLHLGGGSGSGAASLIATTGQFADGALVQSIGGGGGNAGIGASEGYTFYAKSGISITENTGSQGGAGGNGGAASATIAADGVIDTAGVNAMGLVVQSIGGGGGVASGSGISQVGGPEAESKAEKTIRDALTLSPPSMAESVDISLGKKGGGAGDGGTVTVVHDGAIFTDRSGSTGLLAQSIGGGGGVGGAAGAEDEDAEQANDILQELQDIIASRSNAPSTAQVAGAPYTIPLPTIDISADFSFGGTGGEGGTGGAVTVTQNGTIVTLGDFADGLEAQSIGGGGGTGGTAVAGAESNSARSIFGAMRIVSTLSLGHSGDGGQGGDGGAVTIDLAGGSISTGQTSGTGRVGFGSTGILAQSIGGGGGDGADGTTQPSSLLFLGEGINGSGGGSGDGGPVTLRSPANGAIGAPRVTTYGEEAYGVVLQSIGGGGGVAGAGSSIAAGVSQLIDPSVTFKLGSGAGVVGQGGNVTVRLDPTTPVAITTYGVGSFGLVAQSVGGGGGMVLSAIGVPFRDKDGKNTIALGGVGSGSGGDLSITLPTGSVIATTGLGAHGIVAQSVGGGGGIATSYTAGLVPTLTTRFASETPITGSGDGGAVRMTSNADIGVGGAGAFGILAQSVGGGGGLYAQSDGDLFVGTTNGATKPAGSGSLVSLSLGGSIAARGENGIGVFAQSVGPSGNGNVTVLLGIDGTGAEAPAIVTGGSGDQGTGIQIDSGTTSNLIEVGPGSSVSAASGIAIRVTGFATTVDNHGTIYGTTLLNGGEIVGNPQLASPGTLNNAGTLVATPGQQSIIGGNLVQTAGGRIVATADFAGRQSSSYLVTGDAALAGTVQPTLISVLPDVSLPVLTVEGATTGQLAAPDSALFSFRVRQSGNQQILSVAGRDFDQSRFDLTPGRAAVARGLEALFDAAHLQLGGFFAGLDAAAGAGQAVYASSLAQLGPRSAATIGARRAFDAAQIADASMSCPARDGDSPPLTEAPCVYGHSSGWSTSDSGDADRGRLQLDSAVFQIGGQAALRDGVFVGGAIAYETDWYNSRADGVQGHGKAGQAALTIKWQTGRWLLTGAAFGTAGSFDISRAVDILGIAGVGKGSSDMESAGLRLRAAYTLGADRFYLRPYLNVDGIYARSGGYRETGLDAVGLTYGTADQTTLVFNPAVELGSRLKLGTSVLQAFAFGGAAVRTDDSWKLSARLQGAAPGAGAFTVDVPQDRAVAHVGSGLQLFLGRRLDLRLQYDGIYGGRTTSNGGALTMGWTL